MAYALTDPKKEAAERVVSRLEHFFRTSKDMEWMELSLLELTLLSTVISPDDIIESMGTGGVL